MLHACFVRSPHPHAESSRSTSRPRKQAPGVAAVFTAADINPRCEPFVGVALHRPGHRSAPQLLLAAERAVWQGQPVALIAPRAARRPRTRPSLSAIEWEPLPAVGDQMQAIAPGAPVIHAELGDNVAFDFAIEKGRAGQGLRRGRSRHRGGAALRAADGDDAGGARPDRRLQSGRRLARPSSTRTSRRSRCRRSSAGI